MASKRNPVAQKQNSSKNTVESPNRSKRRRTQRDGLDENSFIQTLHQSARGQLEANKSRKQDRHGEQRATAKVDEARAAVTRGGDAELDSKPNGTSEPVKVSSGSEEDSEEGGSDAEPAATSKKVSSKSRRRKPEKDKQNGDIGALELLERDTHGDGKGILDDTEPSFGELHRASHPETIAVETAFEDPDTDIHALAQAPGSQALQAPSAGSIGTVLSQALRTNDIELLESCLHTPEVQVIRATIERLPSPLAAILLQKLAERLHRRPGRAGNLMIWVQWTLVAHGGYLARQPDLMSKLRVLHKVIRDRASGLSSLLSLKGKLDMLDAQMQLRNSMQTSVANLDDSEEDNERVVYVEGQNYDDDSELEDDASGAMTKKAISAGGKSIGEDVDMADAPSEDSDADEAMPTTVNGVSRSSGDEDSESDEEELVDTEAEETDADTGDEVDGSDVESEGSGSDV